MPSLLGDGKGSLLDYNIFFKIFTYLFERENGKERKEGRGGEGRGKVTEQGLLPNG